MIGYRGLTLLFKVGKGLSQHHHYVFYVIMLHALLRVISIQIQVEVRLWFLRGEPDTVITNAKPELRHFNIIYYT